MTAEVRLVDADELRRRIERAADCKVASGRRYGLNDALRVLRDMPSSTAPKGWTRDEVLAELAKHPDNVCRWQAPSSGEWLPMSKVSVERWRNPEVRRFDVRVVRSTPDPEWVPLTKFVGRIIHGCDCAVAVPPIHDTDGGRWVWSCNGAIHRFPDGTLNLDDATVAVRPEAAT